MPITISDKRRAEILAAIHGTIAECQSKLIVGAYGDRHDYVRDVEQKLYEAVIAAAEGRDKT